MRRHREIVVGRHKSGLWAVRFADWRVTQARPLKLVASYKRAMVYAMNESNRRIRAALEPKDHAAGQDERQA